VRRRRSRCGSFWPIRHPPFGAASLFAWRVPR